MGAYEVDSTIEAAEGDFDEDDWIQWEDAADVFDGPLPGEPFARRDA